jgi:hypothetical protein
VALIRTDVSEYRIASIFRVTDYEQVQSETVSSCIDGDSRVSQKMIIIIVTAVETSNLTIKIFTEFLKQSVGRLME